MPSLSTLFVLATTAFAAFTSAAPIDAPKPATDAVSGLPVPNVGNGVSGLDAVSGISPSSVSLPTRRDDLKSLPVILLDVKARVGTISHKLDDIIRANAKVEVEVVVPLLNEVKEVLAGAVVEVKLLVDHPVEFVLSLSGRVLSLHEVAELLAAVLSIVCGILATVLRCVVGIQAQVHGVCEVLVQLLTIVFGVVGGLCDVLHPILGSVVGLIKSIQYDALLVVLKITA